MSVCRSCRSDRLSQVLDLGPIPIAHRFLKSPAGPEEYRHPMVLHLCEDCALLQVVAPLSPEELYRDYNFCFTAWKPQPHMADEIARISRRVSHDDLIVELGSNDGSFLRELGLAGFSALAGVDPNRVANESARRTGASIYEGFFSESLAEEIKRKQGPATLIVSRQAVEHITDLEGLACAVKNLLRADGWFLIEVPNFEGPLSYGDISGLWEEHVNYFTEATMADFLERQGFTVAETARYPFCGGALMVLARLGTGEIVDRRTAIEAARGHARAFDSRAARFRERLQERLSLNHKAGRPNVFYGTGCRANMLVNAWKLAPRLDLLVDDQPEKQGLYLPGTALRIEPSSGLERAVGDCFLSVNAENEDKVVGRHRDYEERGGKFFSVNSPSPRLRELSVAASPE